MEAPDAGDPYSRPARRTQWIVSTLAYHYGLDRGVENEIIVLATGLDQYLQEIFHHLDCQGDGRIPAEDFQILCEILGLNKETESEECMEVLDSLPSEFSFRQFHAKLCGYFSTKAGSHYEDGRLLVARESEHIETQIRLRSPMRRRETLLSPGPGRRTSDSTTASDQHSPGCRQGSCTRECYEDIVALEEAEDRIAKLEEENASLRELVEDMRAALQSSDARSLALQVSASVSLTKFAKIFFFTLILLNLLIHSFIHLSIYAFFFLEAVLAFYSPSLHAWPYPVANVTQSLYLFLLLFIL